MLDFIDRLCSIIKEVYAIIHNSHVSFWNGNLLLFMAYISSLIIIFNSRGKATRGKQLFAAFSIMLLVICYTPFAHIFFAKLPESNDAVYSRIWIILPVWLVIAYAVSELKDKVRSNLLRNGLYLSLSALMVFTGSSIYTLGMNIDSQTPYKVKSQGVEIAEKISSIEGDNPVELLLFDYPQSGTLDNYILGGTIYGAIGQYSGTIRVIPFYVDETTMQDYYLSDTLPDGETSSIEYIDTVLSRCHLGYDFSYIVMPENYTLRERMLYLGYKCISTYDGYDLYQAVPRWWVLSFSYNMEDLKKVYLIKDNMGHFILVDGGSKTDRRQLQQLLDICGGHVDLWIMTSPSATNLEGFNCIVNTEGYTVDSVYLPAIDIDSMPADFMDDRDKDAFAEFLENEENGLFNLQNVYEGDEFEYYGMKLQILSDMLDIQSGNIMDNSMLFRLEMCDKSFLFCSYMGYEQGQIALQKYGDSLDSDYVQIASGNGTGLGMDFYNAVSPDIAFCDSVRDDAARQTYDEFVSAGIKCFSFENGDQSMVMIE